MYRFTLKPRWIGAHLLVVCIAVACVALGLWQLDRHGERRAFNETLERRSAAAPTDLRPDVPAYTRVRATGVYDTSREVVLRSRAYRGRSGHRVLTPLRTETGSAVVVDRGWVPFEMDDPPVAGAEPPSGPVTVNGLLVPSESRSPLGPRDPPTGTLERLSRLDVSRIDAQLPYDVHPLALRLLTQDPRSGELPVPVPVEPLDATQNLSYAGQWFLFAVVGLVGYGVILRKAARRREEGDRVSDAEPTPVPS